MSTRIKLCGLSRMEDIAVANELEVDYIGFVFAKGSRRYIAPEQAQRLRTYIYRTIERVGVFVDEDPDTVARLLNTGVIDIAQLHGSENEAYIEALRKKTDHIIIKAFSVSDEKSIKAANASPADYVLLDNGTGGSGASFDHSLLQGITRAYFLAGGLGVENVSEAVRKFHPFAVDVSSGIETDGKKDASKMRAFTEAVRQESAQSARPSDG